MRALLDEIGLQGERLAMVNLSAVMGTRLAEVATQMTEKVRALGPNPLAGVKAHKSGCEADRMVELK